MSSGSFRSIMSPGQWIVVSMLATICVGTALLSLNYAQVKPISLVDLFFTATSTVCVTGLATVPFTDFTPFGQAILLMLIQIGGLGLITITLFFMYLLVNIGLSGSVIASQILEIDSWRDVRRMIIMIILFTLTCELLGTTGLYLLVHKTHSGFQGFFFALFHAVSAFCNAGIVLASDIVDIYGTSPILLTILALLMLAGGLGFFTWYEIMQKSYNAFHGKRFRLSLHSLLTIRTTAMLISLTTFIYYLLERTNSLADDSVTYGIFVSLFHAISFKSAGFLVGPTILMLHPATILLLFIIAFIGSGAGSTGSGIKVTTFATLVATIRSTIKDRTEVEVANRTLVHDQVHKAVTIVLLSVTWVIVSTFILLITEPNHTFGDLLLEAISAFSCVSIDLMPTFSLTGKIIIMASMIAGRIGPLTILLSLKMRKPETVSTFSYPEERVLLG
jgi:trk system potassium uptake protein TrkH